MPPIMQAPKLVNRGPAGLLAKKPVEAAAAKPSVAESAEVKTWPTDKIAAELKHMAVDISTLSFDPDNARLHPERNLEAIRQSLADYGQVKPIVVRKQTNTVVAGNGTLDAAKSMGWTKLAAVFIEMSDAEAAGYGLADNRTAELAKWDFETVARLERLVSEAGLTMAGWSLDELEVLRAADWTPPAVDDSAGFEGSKVSEELLISFTPEQDEVVTAAVDRARQGLGDLDKVECIVAICRHWLELVGTNG